MVTVASRAGGAIMPGMKLRHDSQGDNVYVTLEGDLSSESCTCLRNFWELRVAHHQTIDVELEDSDTGDGRGIAELAGLVQRARHAGKHVTLRNAPQMLAHTLYKVGALRGEHGVTLIDPREEEPAAY